MLMSDAIVRFRQTWPCICSRSRCSINADVITRRFRAEMAAFWRKKEMTIFFASMAHHFSEHASQVVSRGSVAALIPLEKHATLAHPLRQNLLKSARNFTGADSSSCLHSHPAPRYACGQRSARFVSTLRSISTVGESHHHKPTRKDWHLREYYHQ